MEHINNPSFTKRLNSDGSMDLIPSKIHTLPPPAKIEDHRQRRFEELQNKIRDLPRDIFLMIKDATLALDPITDEEDFRTIDRYYRPPVELQITQSLRKAFMPHYYGSTALWIIPNGRTRWVRRWYRSLSSEAKDLLKAVEKVPEQSEETRRLMSGQGLAERCESRKFMTKEEELEAEAGGFMVAQRLHKYRKRLDLQTDPVYPESDDSDEQPTYLANSLFDSAREKVPHSFRRAGGRSAAWYLDWMKDGQRDYTPHEEERQKSGPTDASGDSNGGRSSDGNGPTDASGDSNGGRSSNFSPEQWDMAIRSRLESTCDTQLM